MEIIEEPQPSDLHPTPTTASPNPSPATATAVAADDLPKKRKREEDDSPPPESSRHPMWKTSLCSYCRRQPKTGSCSHGETCRYAHSEAELRPRPDKSWDPTSDRAKKIKSETEAVAAAEEEEEYLATGVDEISLDKCLIGLPRNWASDKLMSFLDEQPLPAGRWTLHDCKGFMPITGIFDQTLDRVIFMQEAWEPAVEAALGSSGGGGGSLSLSRSLTLDGAVKCIYGQLHPLDRVLDHFQSLEHLFIANIGVSSLEKFPRLRNLQRLILSDNRISGGLEFLVGAGLESLRDLDLSNIRIQTLEDLAPLARLRLVSLDLYECPVTRVADYRVRVFALISSLKYLDKLDSDGNERPESDDEDDDDDEDDEEEEEEEDPGSGEVDGEEKVTNGVAVNGIIDADEDDESDADEEETARPTANGSPHVANGFRVVPVGEDDVDDEDFDEDDVDDEDGDDDGVQGEEIDEDDGEDDDVVEVHDISDSDDGDGVEAEEDLEDEDDEDEVEGDGDEDEEDVEDEEADGEPGSSVRMMSTDGEIDGHEQGEGEGEEDDTGEIGEEDEGVEEDEVDLEEEEEDDLGDDYHVQPHVVRAPVGEFEACNGEDEDGVEDDDDEAHHVHSNGPSASLHPCNGEDEDEDGVEDDNEDLPQQGEDDGPSSTTLASKRKRDAVSDDDVEDLRSSKQR